MHYLLLACLFLSLVYGPQIWVQSVLKRYNRRAEVNFPGTGGEFARHLLDRFNLGVITVEISEQGDHYDPINRSVCLTRDKYEGKTLTAITVAAHECSHALQHAASEPMFLWRTRLAYITVWAQRFGSFLLFSAPVAALLFRVPAVSIINIIGAFLIIGFALVIQILTLPVELDASFNKAMPILKSGYLEKSQYSGANSILRAAAWTYVVASLASLLNFWRWLAVLRR